MTKEEVKQWQELAQVADDIVYSAFAFYIEEKGLKKDNHSIDEWNIEGDEIWIGVDEYWNYGGHDKYSVRFPIECLYQPYEPIISALIRREEQKELESKQKLENAVKEAKEEADRKEYDRLKQKYGA